MTFTIEDLEFNIDFIKFYENHFFLGLFLDEQNITNFQENELKTLISGDKHEIRIMYFPCSRNDKNLVIFSTNKSIIEQIYKLKTTDNNKREYVKIFQMDLRNIPFDKDLIEIRNNPSNSSKLLESQRNFYNTMKRKKLHDQPSEKD